jgi:type I restriction enzyme M protein
LSNFSEKVTFIWSVADLIRDRFKRGEYENVILPLTVLRRIDCVMEPTRAAVRAKNQELAERGLQNRDPALRKVSGYAFYNTSLFDLASLAGDNTHIAANLRNYLAGFSPNMQEIIQRFNFENTINQLDDLGLLFKVVQRFAEIDLHPDRVPNHEMGTIFEELIRKFNEALDENPGEHFTPREVIRLMVDLMLGRDRRDLAKGGVARSVYDPCCGSGGMLTITKDRILEWNPEAQVHLFGQESQPKTWATSKADLLMSTADGRDADNIAFGSVLDRDAFSTRHFDYIIANPPYGKDWKQDKEAVEVEHEKGAHSRFPAGLPRISDGQLLFLQHMVTKMRPSAEHGSRVAIVMNGSPLFSGDAGSGESEVRRWILENDWLEALVALPEQLFYNTGIGTYVWILSNRKAPERAHKVQLIDATGMWRPMKKSLGDKRRELAEDHIHAICDLVDRFVESEHSRIFPTTHFGYRRITVERPLRLNFQASMSRIARLDDEPGFAALAVSKKRDAAERAREEKEGREEQGRIRAALHKLPQHLFKDRKEFGDALDTTLKRAGVKLKAPVRKAVLSALSERDETAKECLDEQGNREADPTLRDYESVPLAEDIHAWFAREVTPYVPEAWINLSVRDTSDGKIGKVGYEVNFNRYFYTYVPPRPLAAIEADIAKVEKEILAMLGVGA